MATTSINIINAALTRTGNNQIDSLNDGSTEAIVANANYQIVVDDALSLHPWNFARQTAKLDKLSADPNVDGLAKFQIPNDAMRVLTVQVGDVPITYRIRGDEIITEYDYESEEPIATYVERVSEPDWPAYFSEIVVVALEIMFLRAINEDDRRADRREDAFYNIKMPRARNVDSQQNAPREKMQSQLVQARRA